MGADRRLSGGHGGTGMYVGEHQVLPAEPHDFLSVLAAGQTAGSEICCQLAGRHAGTRLYASDGEQPNLLRQWVSRVSGAAGIPAPGTDQAAGWGCRYTGGSHEGGRLLFRFFSFEGTM